MNFTDKQGYQVNPDLSLLGYVDSMNCEVSKPGDTFVTRKEKIFSETENVGSEITYRCMRCRACKSCKQCEYTEAVSIREEVEDVLIKKSVEVDVNKRLSIASLPLIHDPIAKLSPNRHKAMKVFNLAGPFRSYYGHNKRASLKIWLVVFCCATTATTSIKVMDNYSSTAFIQSFIRLSCDVGFPKMMLADGGSQ